MNTRSCRALQMLSIPQFHPCIKYCMLLKIFHIDLFKTTLLIQSALFRLFLRSAASRTNPCQKAVEKFELCYLFFIFYIKIIGITAN